MYVTWYNNIKRCDVHEVPFIVCLRKGLLQILKVRTNGF